MFQTKEKAIEAIVKALPYPEQIKDWDLASEKDSLYFSWRSNRLKFNLTHTRIDEVNGNLLVGSNLAMLMTELIKKAGASIIVEEMDSARTQTHSN